MADFPGGKIEAAAWQRWSENRGCADESEWKGLPDYGGSSGIGAAAAVELARRGADIAVIGLEADLEGASRTREKIEVLGRSCAVILKDLSAEGVAAECVALALDRLGGIDVLIHSAGSAAPGSLLQVSPEDWYRAFELHVHAVFHLCRAAVPHMIARKAGAIVLISSAAGLRGCAGALAYGVAKGAIPQFTRSLARELADHNIRVNCIAPGIIRTRFQDYLTPEQVRHNIENRIPLHREGTRKTWPR